MPLTPAHQEILPNPTPAPAVTALYPGSVVAFGLDGPGQPQRLTDEEAHSIEGASQRRREQFAAGRSCARAALEELGFEAVSLPRLGDRRPRWPAGSVGSISHTAGRCVAVAAHHGEAQERIGVDIEQLGRVGSDLHRRLFGPEELSELRRIVTVDDQDRWTTATFGAKEAFYKAQYEITASWVGFQDVTVTWHLPEAEQADVWHGEIHRRRVLDAFEWLRWPIPVASTFDESYATTAATVHPDGPG